MRFTVRRPPNGEVSPCSHRPSGGDIACSVHVGVAPASRAGFAFEHRLALAVFGSDVPARRATLRRVRSRDLFDPAESLVLQTCDQLTPGASTDRSVKSALLSYTSAWLLDGAPRRSGHCPQIEGLDSDHVEPPREVGGRFLHPVFAPIPLAGLQRRDRSFRPSAAIGAALGSGQPVLQHLQPLRLTRAKTGCLQQFAGRQRSRYRNTAVNANHAAVARAGDRIGDTGERDMPAAGPIPSDPVGLHTLWHRPRQPKSHPSDLGHPHSSNTAVQPLDVTRLHPDLSKSFVHTGFTPCRTTMRPGEKVPHSLREVPQRLLLHGLTPGTKPPELGARLRQLSALLVVARRATPRPPVLLLLHGQVPHIPSVAAILGQRRALLDRWKQPVSRHSGNLTATTDKLPKGEAALSPLAEATDFHAANIR